MIFSIIIPVYNTEDYLSQCLDSVVNQTYREIEIIIINDGSTDNSKEIIDEYSRKDSRIIVINQLNKGLSAARNAGLNIATSEYILFVDSVEYIALDTCEKISIELSIFPYDCIIFGRYRFWGKGKKIIDTVTCKKDIYISGDSYISDAAIYGKFYAACWNKIYKKELIQKYNIRFIEGILHEDLAFVFQYLFYSSEIKIYDIPLYYYRFKRKNSIVNTLKEQDKDIFCTIETLEKFLNEINRLDVVDSFYFMKLIYGWVSMVICVKYPSRLPFSSGANKFVKEVLYDERFYKYVSYFAYDQKQHLKYKITAWLSLNAYPLYVIFVYSYFKLKIQK
jgi:glycosyltransferase involved in cell wall biosynthesis